MSQAIQFDQRRRTLAITIQQMPLGDVLQRLAFLCKSDMKAIDLIARDALARRWPQTPEHPLYINVDRLL
jgi:hypothetical protein